MASLDFEKEKFQFKEFYSTNQTQLESAKNSFCSLIKALLENADIHFTKIEGKEFTPIELHFLRKIMDMAINDLEEAWAPVHRIDAQYLRTEINPQFVGVVPPSDVIIATTLEVEFESASGTIMIVVPYSTIEPIKQKLSSSSLIFIDKSRLIKHVPHTALTKDFSLSRA